MLEAAIEAGADDCISDEDGHLILCGFGALNEVSAALGERFGDAESANVTWRPHVQVAVDKALLFFRDAVHVEDDDDVQNVFGNYELPEEFEG